MEHGQEVINERDLDGIVNFLFEVGVLSKTPRSFKAFLGSGDQSVAEHINRMVYIGFCLGHMNKHADVSKIAMMCQFHDITESRISDLNYVHQKYTERKEDAAEADIAHSLPFGNAIQDILREYHERKTPEAILAKDADNIEFLLTLKEQVDIGNERALTWIPAILPRIKTPEGIALAQKITETDSDAWWFGDKDDTWWVSRNKE